MSIRLVLMTGALISLCGCNGYREVPLKTHVQEIQQTQTKTVAEFQENYNGVITEQIAIKLALSFNPEIRTPIIRNRGWGDNEVKLREIVRPELDLGTDKSTLNLPTDVLNLYSLLSHEERHAWRQMRRAERDQAYSDQKGSIIRLTRDVRLAFLELARLKAKSSIIDKQLAYLSKYQVTKKIDKPSSLLLELSIAKIKQESDDNNIDISNAKLNLIRLLGVQSNDSIEFDISNTLKVGSIPEISTILQMSEKAMENNWWLLNLQSKYIIKEYQLRQAYLRRWGSITIGPSITYNREDDEVSSGVSVRVRIPWPSHSDDNISDIKDERSLASARYTAALHELQADIMKQYNEMHSRWEIINNRSVDVNKYEEEIEKQINNFSVNEYIVTIDSLCDSENKQVDELSKYKMSFIILESLIK